jgi:aminoglycoside phosphotransferase (APT) family kinase protein
VLADLGLPGAARAVRAPSALNEVWLLDDMVLRVAPLHSGRLRYEAAVAACLPPEVGYPEILGAGEAAFGEWLLLRRTEGVPLGEAWVTMGEADRREAIAQLAGRMELIHATPAPPLEPPFASDPLACPHPVDPPGRLVGLIARARRLPHVDPAVLDGAGALLERCAPALDTARPTGLVHGDLHLENVLWDGNRISAVVDFEFARAGPPDLDLDILLRFCAAPELHVAEAYRHAVSAADFRMVPAWLRRDYPAVFAHPRLIERLTIYALAYDVRALLCDPPSGPPDTLAPHHPYHRVRRAVEGRSPFAFIEL